MAKKILHIVETAYRATIEEQDDPVLWVAHAMQNNGASGTVLLRANAVNYAVRAQSCTGLKIAGWQQTKPPRLQDDLLALKAKGVPIHIVAEDLAERGLQAKDLVDGLHAVGRADLPKLFEAHDLVWHW